MVVSAAKYVSSVTGHNSHILATIDGVEMAVPMDNANRHYIEILKWVDVGNSIQAAD